MRFKAKLNFSQTCPVLAIARNHVFYAGVAAGVINNIARTGINKVHVFLLALFIARANSRC